MRVLAVCCLALAAPVLVIAPAEAQARKKRSETVIVVKPRSFLDAGTQVQPGSFQKYSLGQTPFRPTDSIIPTGSPQSRLLPGPFGPAHY